MARPRDEMLRFACAGVAGFVTDVTVLYLALAIGLGYYLGRVVSFLCAVFVTWQLNRRYAFGVAAHRAASWREWWAYLATMLGGGAFNYAAYSLLVAFGPRVPLLPLLAVAAGALAGMTVNYFGAKFLVFRRGQSP